VVQPPAEACAETGQVCQIGIAGAGRAAPLGAVTFTATLVADFGQPLPPPPGFFVCAPLGGRVTIRATDPARVGTVAGPLRGQVCINDGGPTFFARFALRRGTGRYRGVRGSATFVPVVVGEAEFVLTGRGQMRF
jgi:hypothetical protein